jgi:hypothetical protein
MEGEEHEMQLVTGLLDLGALILFEDVLGDEGMKIEDGAQLEQ